MMCSDVLQRARHEEVLLQQAQPLADLGLVVRVQHLGDGLRGDLVLDRLVVVAGVECVQRERLDGPRAPQRQHVAGVHAVTLDRGVVGDALDAPAGHPPDAVAAGVVGVVLGVAAPLDEVVHVGFGDLPRVSVGQPVVGLLDLPAVVDLLVEDAELVADAVADGRPLEGGQRVEVARGEPAEAAVAQSRFLLAGQHLVEVLARAARAPCGPRPRSRGSAGCCPAADPSGTRPTGSRSPCGRGRATSAWMPPGCPACGRARPAQRPVVVLGPQGGGGPADRIAQVVDDAPLQRMGGQTRSTALAGIQRGGGGWLDDVSHRRSLAFNRVAQMNFRRASWSNAS